MRAQRNNERLFLEAGVAKLKPLFTSHGFEYSSGDQAVSSGGPFATGFFRRDKLEIGLIVRDGNRLGCPNYSEGHGYASHGDVFWALGRAGEARLVPADFLFYKARDGGDSFDALQQDFEQVILPALQHSPDGFSAAIARAHRKFQNELRGKSG
jgi:hypothetical protein